MASTRSRHLAAVARSNKRRQWLLLRAPRNNANLATTQRKKHGGGALVTLLKRHNNQTISVASVGSSENEGEEKRSSVTKAKMSVIKRISVANKRAAISSISIEKKNERK